MMRKKAYGWSRPGADAPRPDRSCFQPTRELRHPV